MTAPESHAPAPMGGAYVKLVLLAAAIGVPAALVAALLLAFVHDAEGWLWTDLPQRLGCSAPPWYLVIGLPVAGALVVIVARRFLPGDGGHPPLGGISLDPTPVSHAPGVALAAIGSLSFGAVLGPEMPVIALGSAVGMVAVSLLRLGRREGGLIATAGSFSAVSALFGGPIVAGVMLTEAGVGLGARLIPTLLPGFVAAAVGYLVFVGFGDWGGLNAPGLAVGDLPPYDGTHLRDLVVAVAVGVVTAVAIAAVRRLATQVAVEGARRLAWPALLVGGGLAIGLITVVADALGDRSDDVLFSGQASIPTLVGRTTTGIVLLMIVAKALAYAVSLACGFRGGPIFPAVFLGIGIATLGVVWFDMSPTVAVAIGAAAGMAAQARLLLTAIVLASLLVGAQGADAVPAAVLAAAAAWMTVVALDRPARTSTPPREAADG